VGGNVLLHEDLTMPGIAMKKAVATELQRQFNEEFGAAHAYVALAIWCHDQNLKGFARYFSKQAGEERAHAQKLMTHLLDRGVRPLLTSVAAPRAEFEELLDVARQAQAMEQKNTVGIHACYKAAVKEGDAAAQVLLQWFISEQVEEENWTDEMVQRVERASCAGGLAELDRHIEKYLSEGGLQAGEAEG
jgi:ferritin